MSLDSFHPPPFLSHTYAQTFLASLRLRNLGKNSMVRCERPVILDTPNGTRLSGYYSPSNRPQAKGLVILLHGWEGSARSTYILQCGKHLHQNGHAVFRLNFRDHGDSHSLNPGLFYATLLDEVYQGVQLAVRHHGKGPACLVGFSLGGNFAIRIAVRHSSNNHRHLSQVISISPVLDPDKATDRIDGHPIILAYFLNKWRRSLKIKQRLFPDIYSFDKVLQLKNLRQMTEQLIRQYAPYADARQYFSHYAIPADALSRVTLPLTLIAAADDPIIPVEDFYDLRGGSGIQRIIHAKGGHNGFIEGLFRPAWYDRYLVQLLDRSIRSA